MILAVRTDKPEAELYILESDKVLFEERWQAHRELSNTLLGKIESGLKNANKSKGDITGLIVFSGPGSFTGLRIGITVLNTLAYTLKVPVVGANGEDWLKAGLERLSSARVGDYVSPEYGAQAHITKPRK